MHKEFQINFNSYFISYTSEDTRLMICKLWLSLIRNLSSMPRCPSSILIRILLENTLNQLTECHRSEMLQEMAHLPVLAILSSNDEVTKSKGHEIVNEIKKTLAKLDPKSEIATTNDCVELVTPYFFNSIIS